MRAARSLIAACRHSVVLAQQRCRCSRSPAVLPSGDLGLASSHEEKAYSRAKSIFLIQSSEFAPLLVKAKQQVPVPMQMHAIAQFTT